LNGRTLGDSVGKATYFNYSGVTINDYCICSASFLKNITSFQVGDFDRNLSDHFFFFHFCKTIFLETPLLPRTAFLRFVEKFVTISFKSETGII
jgi:hypothetical protein